MFVSKVILPLLALAGSASATRIGFKLPVDPADPVDPNHFIEVAESVKGLVNFIEIRGTHPDLPSIVQGLSDNFITPWIDVSLSSPAEPATLDLARDLAAAGADSLTPLFDPQQEKASIKLIKDIQKRLIVDVGIEFLHDTALSQIDRALHNLLGSGVVLNSISIAGEASQPALNKAYLVHDLITEKKININVSMGGVTPDNIQDVHATGAKVFIVDANGMDVQQRIERIDAVKEWLQEKMDIQE